MGLYTAIKSNIHPCFYGRVTLPHSLCIFVRFLYHLPIQKLPPKTLMFAKSFDIEKEHDFLTLWYQKVSFNVMLWSTILNFVHPF